MIDTIFTSRKRFTVTRSLRTILLLGLTFVATSLCSTPGYAASTDSKDNLGTPGLYAHPAPHPEGTDLEFFTTVTTKPSASANVFWSHQFGISGLSNGYIGFQTRENNAGENLILFSVWGATNGEPTKENQGFLVGNTDGQAGVSVRIWKKWEANRKYKFRVKPIAERENWWNGSITDMTTGETTSIGNLKFGSSSKITPQSSWVEYWNWNNPNAKCGDQEPSSAQYSPVKIDGKMFPYIDVTNSSTCIYANHSYVGTEGTAFMISKP